MGTVPESIDEYYGPQPKYDYTWKGIKIQSLKSVNYVTCKPDTNI